MISIPIPFKQAVCVRERAKAQCTGQITENQYVAGNVDIVAS